MAQLEEGLEAALGKLGYIRVDGLFCMDDGSGEHYSSSSSGPIEGKDQEITRYLECQMPMRDPFSVLYTFGQVYLKVHNEGDLEALKKAGVVPTELNPDVDSYPPSWLPGTCHWYSSGELFHRIDRMVRSLIKS